LGELKFEQDLVRALLRDQCPDLAGLELRDVSGGWEPAGYATLDRVLAAS
jgi:hypothetical protein